MIVTNSKTERFPNNQVTPLPLAMIGETIMPTTGSAEDSSALDSSIKKQIGVNNGIFENNVDTVQMKRIESG